MHNQIGCTILQRAYTGGTHIHTGYVFGKYAYSDRNSFDFRFIGSEEGFGRESSSAPAYCKGTGVLRGLAVLKFGVGSGRGRSRC